MSNAIHEAPPECPKCGMGKLGPPRYVSRTDKLVRVCGLCGFRKEQPPMDKLKSGRW